MKLTKEQIEELIDDQGNTLFGISFHNIQKILYEYQTQGVNAGRIRERIRLLEYTIRELLKGGEHDGPCNQGDLSLSSFWETGPCLEHLKASEIREQAARKVLEEYK